MRNVQVIQGLPFNVKPFIDITDTLPTRPNDPEPYRSPQDITHISVHHSAVEGGSIRGYADYHVNVQKWYHIGYHMVVKGDQVYQTNDLLTFSYHTSSNNGHTIGLSVSADLSKRPMSEGERNNLYASILTVMGLFNIPVENVWGHNQFPNNVTSCPCIDMNQLRGDIRGIQLKMRQDSSWEARIRKAGEVTGALNYWKALIDNRPNGQGEAEWGLNNYTLVYDLLKEKGLV